MKRFFPLFLSLALGFSSAVKAQTTYMPAVYPAQQTTAGKATLTENAGVYTLANQVLTATFRMQDGKLLFGGCPEMNLEAGTELFQLQLGSTGSIVRNASQLTVDAVWMEDLAGKETAVKGSEHFDGKALCVRFLHGSVAVVNWRAVLRDGSHYLRTEMELTPNAGKNLRFYRIIPMIYQVDASAAGSVPKKVGNTRGAVLLSDHIFAGLETPMGINTSSADDSDESYETVQAWAEPWVAADWQTAGQNVIPKRVNEVGFYHPNVVLKTRQVTLPEAGRLIVELLYASGSNRLNTCGVDLLDADGNVVASDYHYGYTGSKKQDNIYRFDVPYAGTFTLRFWAENKTEAINSTGNINITLGRRPQGTGGDDAQRVELRGVWSRNTTLLDGENWKVSAVVGLVSPGQKRRSFLAYSERERAVPWRPFPCYISWYELNIDRNNAPAPGYEGNMTIAQCVDVMNHWKTDFYDKYGMAPASFIWDDGWDSYGTWTFSPNFPTGFREVDNLARQMGTSIGAWLGPVGGYGTSGNYRRAYWSDKGGMVLSNPAYYAVFKAAAKNLTQDQGYAFNFFKFDGISAQFSAVGPDDGDTGNENAEGIIRLERFVREELKEDIFFNTTVGTWASPFWFRYTDAIWRQEADYGTIGNNSIDRENWITYRDRLVYQNFVQNSPICPINTLMTHGFILSRFGAVSKNMSYEAVRRELRCAFACGSGMVELYNDYELMNSINGGKLWADLAECIAWQKKNADVLPDIHWVGGNPWNGSRAEVYGWASWNGTKSTLALRNGANGTQTYTTTLRKALEIPEGVTGKIVLTKSFAEQASLQGLTEGVAIDIDQQLTLTLPGSSVYVFDGLDSSVPVGVLAPAGDSTTKAGDMACYSLDGRRVQGKIRPGIYVWNGQKCLMK